MNKKRASKKNSYALITGSAGLVGSESTKFFIQRGFTVYGVDNDMRKYFFGEEASPKWNIDKLQEQHKDKYVHFNIDIRDSKKLEELFKMNRFEIIIHTAAQPSHDWSVKEPITDFGVNALATLYLLENYRKYCPEAIFIFTSTNKVYGDRPNKLPFIERETRYELPKNHQSHKGIDESVSIDGSTHTIFGASKVAADIMVQEYGRYFKLRTGVFRGGCLTGPAHSGTKLHGFLTYLIRCIATDTQYTIFGYKGKQVRDNIHVHDLINAFYLFYKNPTLGEAYNIGGSRYSNTSILEAIKKIESIFHKKAKIKYIDQNRSGDHIWYISDISKFQKQYPEFVVTYNIDRIIEDICRYGHFN